MRNLGLASLLTAALAVHAAPAAAQSGGDTVTTPSGAGYGAGISVAPSTPAAGGSTTITGNTGSPAAMRGTRVPDVHTVERGDTLWGLSDRYYGNPYEWPRVWSFNPQVQNPHWIYPGDEVRMRPTGVDDGSGGMAMEGGGLIDRRAMVPRNTVFLRNQGYIDDPNKDVWGELVGSREEQMLLSDGNRVYLLIRKGVDVKVGQTLTIFRKVRQPGKVKGSRRPPGAIVAVKGTVRVDHWDAKKRIARGEIVESVDPIERGDLIGPVGRRFDVVPPKKTGKDVWARVLTGFHPHVFFGQNQLVFIDRGSDDGLSPGNRLFVVRRGDAWRKSLRGNVGMARERLRMDDPSSVPVETTPLRGKDADFPEEIVGELRVLRTRKKSSLAMVVISHREIESGDRAIAKKGY